MKNKIMILAMITVVGLSAAGCSNTSNAPAELTSGEIQALQAVTELKGMGV